MRAPLWFALLCTPALAQQAADTTVDISRCMDIRESAERIRCYNALADEVRARELPAASERKVQSYGNESARVVDTEERSEELHDRVASLKRVLPDRWIVTLASGQVWRQTVTASYNLREGMEVRIYPTRFGNGYRLSAQGLKGFIQVERIK